MNVSVSVRVASYAAGVLACVALLPLTGCETPPGSTFRGRSAAEVDPLKVKTQDDITAIYQFYGADPWLRSADGEVVGFKTPVYFYSGGLERGAFVPGTILVWLYEVRRKADGSLAREYVHGWELDATEAMGYRSRKRVQMGNFYGFFFRWPPELELVGKQIEIVFGYERLDGKIITGPARRFRVPLPVGYPRARVRGQATTQPAAPLPRGERE